MLMIFEDVVIAIEKFVRLKLVSLCVKFVSTFHNFVSICQHWVSILTQSKQLKNGLLQAASCCLVLLSQQLPALCSAALQHTLLIQLSNRVFVTAVAFC